MAMAVIGSTLTGKLLDRTKAYKAIQMTAAYGALIGACVTLSILSMDDDDMFWLKVALPIGGSFAFTASSISMNYAAEVSFPTSPNVANALVNFCDNAIVVVIILANGAFADVDVQEDTKTGEAIETGKDKAQWIMGQAVLFSLAGFILAYYTAEDLRRTKFREEQMRKKKAAAAAKAAAEAGEQPAIEDKA